jgi:hypothetical protein
MSNDAVAAAFIPVSRAVIEGLNECFPASTRQSQRLKSVQKLSTEFPPSPGGVYPQVIDKKTAEFGTAGDAAYQDSIFQHHASDRVRNATPFTGQILTVFYNALRHGLQLLLANAACLPFLHVISLCPLHQHSVQVPFLSAFAWLFMTANGLWQGQRQGQIDAGRADQGS